MRMHRERRRRTTPGREDPFSSETGARVISPPAREVQEAVLDAGSKAVANPTAVCTDLSPRGVIRASLRPNPLGRLGVTAECDTFARYSRHRAWIRKNMVLETLGSP
jgi:hypothetical protein